MPEKETIDKEEMVWGFGGKVCWSWESVSVAGLPLPSVEYKYYNLLCEYYYEDHFFEGTEPTVTLRCHNTPTTTTTC